MTTTKKLFELAQLAEASYGDFDNENLTNTAVKTALKDYSFSDKQADEFLLNWKVVHHQPDTDSDYSGTLFQYIGNDPNSGFTNGELVFSQRGTKGLLGDVVQTDIGEIVVNGLAYSQIVDMYNYWQRLTAIEGANVLEARLVLANPLTTPGNQILVESSINLLVPNIYKTIEFVDVAGAGLGKADASNLSDVTGHSLGGHLAVAFTRIFGSEATTINGAGFATGLLPGLGLTAGNNIPNLFSMLVGDNTFTPTRIANIFGDKNPEIVTQDGPGLFQQGSHDSLFIEQDNFFENALGHGGAQMTDSLAIANLFIQLDSSIASMTGKEALTKLNSLLENASNQRADSLEKTVVQLRMLILGEGASTIATDDRDALYVSLKSLQDSTAFQSLIGNVTIEAAPTSVEQARNGFGAFLSLVNLTPFTLKQNDLTAEPVLKNINPTNAELALKWAEDNVDTAERVANGEAHFSDQYLADRTTMLGWVIKANKDDAETSATQIPVDFGNVFTNAEPVYYQDIDTQTEVYLGSNQDRKRIIFGSDTSLGPINNDTLTGGNQEDNLYGLAGNDILNGNGGNDYLEGGEGQDTLNGDEDNDTLLGGTGVDVLTGGEGTDFLYGGGGADIYEHSSGDGDDFIEDLDGGVIKSDGQTISGGKKNNPDDIYWESADEKFLFYIVEPDLIGQKLHIIIKGSGEKIIVSDWQDGKFGITLDDADEVTPPTPTPITNGDNFQYVDGSAVDGLAGNDGLVGGGFSDTLIGGLATIF